MKIQIIGRGNVGTNMQAAFLRQGIQVDMVSGHTLEGLRTDANIYIYCVRDTVLSEVVQAVHVSPDALHVHTSGTMPVSVFGDDKPHAGVLYPLQTFSKSRIIEDFTEIPVFVEARQTDDLAAIYTLAQNITSHVYEVKQSEREKLHTCGVLVNNFPNALYAMAAELLESVHIPFQVLLPLIDETAAKVHTMAPREAQTGPAVRGDKVVMDKHKSLLTKEDAELYQMISNRILNKYGN